MGISSVTTSPHYSEDYARGFMRHGVLVLPESVFLVDEETETLLAEDGGILLDEGSTA